MRVLLAMWEGGGTIPPELTIARKLIARGHTVRVLGDPTIERAARAAGCAFSPWVEAPHRTNLDPSTDILRDWEFKNPFALLRHGMKAFFCGPSGAFADDTARVMQTYNPDIVLVDWILFGAAIAAKARRVPCATLVPNIYMRPAPGIPPFGMGLMPARGFAGRVRDALLANFSARLWKPGLLWINETRRRYGLPPATDLMAQADELDAVYVLTTRAFDFEATSLPANVRYTGPQLDDPDWAAPWTLPWPATDTRPLVLVSLSSTFQNQASVLRSCLAALAALPVRALVTVGPAVRPADFPSPGPHVSVVQSAPHTQVLPHARAIVTHCGHGTVMKALAAGVPVVAIPMGRDQPDTAARIVGRHAGVRLKPAAGAAEIAHAIQRVIDDPSFAAAAREQADAIRRETAAFDIAGDIERLARGRLESLPSEMTAAVAM